MTSLNDQLISLCESPPPTFQPIADLLRKQGTDANTLQKDTKLTPLWLLIYAERIDLAEKFVDFCYSSNEYKGPKLRLDVRDDDGEGTTYLCLACFEGHQGLARALVKNGAELEARDNGFTPLALAAYTDRLEIVILLLSAGANPQAKHAQSQESVLTLAVHNGNAKIANALVEKMGVQGVVGEREFVLEFLVKNGIVEISQ